MLTCAGIYDNRLTLWFGVTGSAGRDKIKQNKGRFRGPIR